MQGRKSQFLRTSATLMAVGLCACAPNQTSEGKADPIAVPDRDATQMVAEVNGTPLYGEDVRRAAEAQGLIGADTDLPPDDPIFTITLDSLIDQRLLALDAKRTGLANSQEARLRLAMAQDRILGNYRVETHLDEKVNEQTILELYEAQRALAGQGEERLIRRIVVDEAAIAADIAQRLDEEEDFEALANEFSIEASSRDLGGSIGWVSRNMLSGGVAANAFSTPVGQRSAPFQVGATWHILEVQDTRTPSARSFEDVREDLTRFMTFQAVDALMTELRDRAEIVRLYETMPDPEGAEDAALTGEDGNE